MKTIKVVSAIIIKNNQVLACQRSGGKYDGYYEFPGGKVESQETDGQALIREINEELGVVIYDLSYYANVCYQYPDFMVDMNCYLGRIDSKIRLNVHSKAVWSDLTDDLKWLPGNEDLIKRLRKDLRKKLL